MAAGVYALVCWFLLAWKCASADSDPVQKPGEHGPPFDASVSALQVILDAEIRATSLAIELYERKKRLLAARIAQLAGQKKSESQLSLSAHANSTAGIAAAAGQERYSSKQTRWEVKQQLFKDWFAPHSSFRLDTLLDTAEHAAVLLDTFAFQANSKPVGKDTRHQSGRSLYFDNDSPALQFIAVLDPETAMLHMFHPVSRELLWQSRIPEIHDVFAFTFSSDRKAHLSLLTRSGRVALYRLRLWHNGRAVSGGFRRLDPLGLSQCPIEPYDEAEIALPWRVRTAASSPARGKHLHVDIELVFRTPLTAARPATCSERLSHGSMVMTTKFQHNYVVISDGRGMLSFLDAINGTLVASLRVPSARHVAMELEPLAGGVLAIGVHNRVHFVDVIAQKLLPVECEAPQAQSITSIKADPVHPFTIYVGMSNGRGLVFRLRNVSKTRHGGPPNGRPMCTLTSQLTSPRNNFGRPNLAEIVPANIAIVSGYLVMSTASRLVLFQFPVGDRHQLHCIAEHDVMDGEGIAGRQIASIRAATDITAHPAALVVSIAAEALPNNTASPTRYVEVYSSQLQPPPIAGMNLSWVRFPVLLIGVLVAMFWQQRAKPATSNSPFSDGDLAQLAGLRGEWSKPGFFANQRARQRL